MSTDELTILHEKIRNQAKRLCSLQEYISICEKRIQQYNPKEKIPLTKQSLLSKPVDVSTYNLLQEKYNNLYESQIKTKFSKKPSLYTNSTQFKTSNNIPIDEIYEQYNKLQTINENLLKEKDDLVESIKKEMINNDQQRNYIEILKQAIETSLIKSGLKSKIDFLKKKYYQDYPEDEYAKIILDISNMKEKNDELTKKNENLSKNIEIISSQLNEQKDEFQKLQNSFDNLKENNEKMVKEKNELETREEKANLASHELNAMKKKYEEMSDEHNIATNANKLYKEQNDQIKEENQKLKEQNQNFQLKITELNDKINSIIKYQVQYENLFKENKDIKEINQNLTNENNFVIQQNDLMKNDLNILEQIKNENYLLNEEIKNLKERLEILLNEKSKNENYFLAKIESITQEKNTLENILYRKEATKVSIDEEKKNEINSYKQDNKKLYDRNKDLNEENLKYQTENKFYSNLLFRIMKFHISDLNVKNIIMEILSLNEKILLLSVENKKNEIKLTKSPDDNLKSKIYSLQRQLHETNQKMDYLENELKQFEVVY